MNFTEILHDCYVGLITDLVKTKHNNSDLPAFDIEDHLKKFSEKALDKEIRNSCLFNRYSFYIEYEKVMTIFCDYTGIEVTYAEEHYEDRYSGLIKANKFYQYAKYIEQLIVEDRHQLDLIRKINSASKSQVPLPYT